MNNSNIVDGAIVQQYTSKPQQQIQVQYQFQKQNILLKPPSQTMQAKTIPKQPIFGQKKQEFTQHNLMQETSPDMRINIQKRESLPKNFQYRVTSVDKNKENLTNVQQNQQPNQAVHVRERSFDNYQSVPPTNMVHIHSQPQIPSDQAQSNINNTVQTLHNQSQHNTSIQSQNGNGSYTSQQQNKQMFQQQYYSNPNQSLHQKPQTNINQLSPIPKTHNQQQVNQQQQQQQNVQQNTVKVQQQQQQQENLQQNQQEKQYATNQNSQIPINLIQEIVKAEVKAAFKDFKKEEKQESLTQRGDLFEDKIDKSSLKQLIQVESSQISNEIYQFISELKDDFSARLTKLSDQIHLNSESCKSNAYAVSQISEKIMNFSKEYSETTNKIKEDKGLSQIQISTFDEKYNALCNNFTKQMLDMENNFKRLLVEEGAKIEKQIQQLVQEYNILSSKRNIPNQPSSSQSSPQKNNKSIHIHNKSSDQIFQQPQNISKSPNTSIVQNLNDYASIHRDNSSIELDQNQQSQQISRNTSSLSQINLPPQSPNYQQEQYSYSNRSSTQYSRRSHTESNISQSGQNVLPTSPTAQILPNNINNIENYVKKYEDFNKEVDNYLQNRKIPLKVQELMNQSTEMKNSNLFDQGYTGQQQQQFLIQQTGQQVVSPRPLFVNKPLIPTSPNVLIVSPPQTDKLQMQTQYDQLYRQQMISQPQFSQQTSQIQNIQSSNQIQQIEQKRLNYQSLQQNRKAFEDYNGNSINSSTQISPQRVEQINLDVDSFNNEIQFSNNKQDKNNINSQVLKSNEVSSPQKPIENMKFSIIRSQQKNPQLSMISEQDNEEEELIYQLDEQGFLMDEHGQYILDDKGQQVKLSGEQIDYLRNQNILEE